MKKFGLCLGGGGARGISHIAFLKVLDELNIKPCMISGSSMGAIIGAFYGAGMSGQDIEDLLHEIGLKELQKMLDFAILSRSSLIKGKGIERFLSDRLPVSLFSELKIPLKIVATDFWRESMVVFEKGEIVPAIRASISIPALFDPVVIKQSVLIDGGVFNNLPYDIIHDECKFVIAIDVSGSRSIPAKLKKPNWFDSIYSTLNIMQQAILEYQMKIKRPDIYVKPALKDFGLLEFDKSYKILASVESDTEKFRKELISRLKLK
jgi:NTE family protein